MVFRELRSPSAFKAIVFGLLLAVAGSGELGVFPVFLFAGGAALLYLFPLFRTARLFPSFAVLSAASALASIRFGDTPLHVPLVALAACSCYVLLRLKDLAFVFRDRWHYFFVLTTSYLVFVAALPSLAARFGTFRLAGIAAALAILLSQFFGEERERGSGIARRSLAIVLSIALVVSQILWATTVLPMGILNAASIGLIALFAAVQLTLRYGAEGATRQAIAENAFLVGVLIAIVLLATRWSIH